MSFNIDESFDEDGINVEFQGSTFLIASVNRMTYQRMLSKLRYPHRYKIEKGNIDPSILLEIMCKSLSKTILLDWSNVTDNQGNEVPYSQEMAYKALQNGSFREFVISTATDLDNFRAEQIEDAVKS